MALTWDVSSIKDHESVTTSPFKDEEGNDKWHPVTMALISIAVTCGIDSITEKNLGDVWLRVQAYQRVYGPLVSMNLPYGDVYLTRDDVEAHVGLRTNACRVTNSAFDKWLLYRVKSHRYLKRMNTLQGPVDFIERGSATAREAVAHAAAYFEKKKHGEA